MLVLSRYVSESVILEVAGVRITVTLVACGHGRARIGFTAPREVVIDREEVHLDKLREAERKAAEDRPC